MLFLLFFVWSASSQFTGLGQNLGGNFNQLINYCNDKNCFWNCMGNCKGLFVCGPNSDTCDFNCPAGRCNDEIAIISLSSGKTTVNCGGEAVCNKMVVSCGDFSPQSMARLNNVGGTIQHIFERMLISPFPGKTKNYGKCNVNCGPKSCIDMSLVCMGDFANGAGCEMTAQGQLSFENARYICGMKQKNSHCQANCGMPLGSNPAQQQQQQYNPNYFNHFGQFGSDYPCHNGFFDGSANAACSSQQCPKQFYCNGLGCSQQDIMMYGRLTRGYKPFTFRIGSIKPVTKSTTTIKPIKKVTTTKTKYIPTNKIPKPFTTKKNPYLPPINKPIKPKRPIRVYTHSIDRPLKPGFLRGQFTHIDCVQANCKFLCERPGDCNGLTIVADIPVRELLVECSTAACVGLKVLTNAYHNTIKCKDSGACAAANIRCGKNKNPFARVYGVIKTCKVECSNGGCSFYSNPLLRVPRQKGLQVTCNPDVIKCRIYADSANSLYPHPNNPVQNNFLNPFGQSIPNNPNLLAPRSIHSVGSFGDGYLLCNIRKVPLPILNNPLNQANPFPFSPNPNQNQTPFGGRIQPVQSLGANVPTCFVQCSSRRDRRYCKGFHYVCKSAQAQCQCEDFCTQHITECLRENVSSDCPKRIMPTLAPTLKPTFKPTTTTPKLTTKFNENNFMKTTVKTVTKKVVP